MTYRYVATLISLICLALFSFLLVTPNSYPALYGVQPGPGTAFLGQRFSPFLLGLAIILWGLRDLPPGRNRDAVCLGAGGAFAVTAATGILDFAAGQADVAILGAAVVELAVCAAFLWVRRR